MIAINLIDYYIADGFKISSDPRKYDSGIFGVRNYTVNGYNYDSWCGGLHEAVDVYREHGAPIKSFADGIVTLGTGFGGYGYQVCVAYSDLDIQVTFGHVQNNIPVKVGQKVKKGQVIAYQGNTHNQGAGVSMDSHLHITTQNLEYIPDEWTFICRGINPFNIDIDTGKPIKAPATPSNKQPAEVHRVKKGETLYSLSKKYNTTVDELKSLNGLKSNLIQTDQVLKIKDKAPVTPAKKPAASKPKTPRTIGSWQTNEVNGAQYIKAEGTFTVGSEPIMSRFDNPSIDNDNKGGWAKPGDKYKYQYLVRANGYVWVQYELNGRQKFLPYNTWNSKTGKVGKDEWGSFS